MDTLRDLHDRPPSGSRRGPLLAAVATVLAMLAAVLGLTTVTQEPPAYLATAVMAPVGCDWRTAACVATDANVAVWEDGRVDIEAPTYGRDGHAALPSWRADLGSLPDGSVPFAPAMGWNVSFMGEVAAKIRPLRYCVQERRTWDVAHPGFDTTAVGVQAVREVFDLTFDILPSVQNCDDPDLVLGANAEVDCGSAGAWGCAALRFRDGGRYVRVTFNGTLLSRGEMPLAAVRAIDWHELGHAGDLNHTGEYGGEGRSHPHRSNLGYICVQGQIAHPCDNPTGEPGAEDWDDGTGAHRNRYGLRLRGQEPQPPPPPPSPTPTPSPPPPLVVPHVRLQRWIEASREPCAQPSGDWCIETGAEVSPPTEARPWYTIIIDRGGVYEYPVGFVEVAP